MSTVKSSHNIEELDKRVHKIEEENKARKLGVVVSEIVGSTLFSAIIFIVFYRIFVLINDGKGFVPFLTKIWEKVALIIAPADASWYTPILRLLLIAYVLPFVASLIITKIFPLFYFKKPYKPTSGDDELSIANRLLKKAEDTNKNFNEIGSTLLYTIVLALAFAGFVLQLTIIDMKNEPSTPFYKAAIVFIVASAMAIALLVFLFLIFVLINTMFSKKKVDKTLTGDIKDHIHYLERKKIEEQRKKHEEEKKILAARINESIKNAIEKILAGDYSGAKSALSLALENKNYNAEVLSEIIRFKSILLPEVCDRVAIVRKITTLSYETSSEFVAFCKDLLDENMKIIKDESEKEFEIARELSSEENHAKALIHYENAMFNKAGDNYGNALAGYAVSKYLSNPDMEDYSKIISLLKKAINAGITISEVENHCTLLIQTLKLAESIKTKKSSTPSYPGGNGGSVGGWTPRPDPPKPSGCGIAGSFCGCGPGR